MPHAAQSGASRILVQARPSCLQVQQSAAFRDLRSPYTAGMAAEDIDLQLFMSLADEAGGPADGEGPAAQLEEDDIFLQLAEAANAEGEVADEGGSGGNSPPGGGSQRAATSSGGGPRLSWAAKAAAVGSAGAVPPGYQPRQAVLLPPGAIPRSAAAPALLLPGQQPGGGGGGGRVAIFGAAPKGGAASGAGAGGAAAGSFTDVGQGSLVERYAGLKVPAAACQLPACLPAPSLRQHPVQLPAR